jgi:hypothetical protein
MSTQVEKEPYRNRAGVLEKTCSGTFKSQLLAFLNKIVTSLELRASVTLNFLKIRNCKDLEIPLPGSDVATFG